MAFFNRFKNVSGGGERRSPDASESARPSEEGLPKSAEEKPAEEYLAEPLEGTEDYLLYELRRNRAAFPGDEAAAMPAVPSAMNEIRERQRLLRQYAEAPETLQPENAKVITFTDSSRMIGFLFCLKPLGAAAPITENAVLKAVLSSGICYGLDQTAISKVANEKAYDRIFVIARGTFPVKGADGQVIDHFSRDQSFHLTENEWGMVDYKNSGHFQSVNKGDVICDLVPPQMGTAGKDVTGKTLLSPRGDMPRIPQGKNTSVTLDQRHLIADEGGDLAFEDGVFRVEPKLIISGDVDASTGNIHFAGDVVIYGEIRQGFEVEAGGSLSVRGMAEGAVLTAGKDVLLEKGMNGSSGGSLTAGGSIRSRFLEQLSVEAEGDVIADVLINCDIRAGGSVLANSGKGIIVGGTVRAGRCVEARRIGNLSEIQTVIKIGVPFHKEESVHEVRKELKEAQDTLDKINKNYDYLNRQLEIPEKHKELYTALREQKGLYEAMVEDIQSRISELERRKKDYISCYVRADTIHGVTEIVLENSHLTIREESSGCNIYYSKDKGGLVQGSI